MATYYIDFTAGSDANAGTSTGSPLKRAPGMTGYTGSVTPAAGDTFNFKGGETWTSGCFPWTISQSGSSGNIITYTSDESWYTGGSWARPILDANHLEPTGGTLGGTGRSYLTFSKLHFLNHATTGVKDGTKAVDFLNSHHLTFTNNRFQTYCWLAVYVHFEVAGT